MTTPQPPLIGLLLEWRQVEDKRGVQKWEGRVAFARVPNELEVKWIRAAMLRPAYSGADP